MVLGVAYFQKNFLSTESEAKARSVESEREP
jgi:hypothetical protein